MFTVIIIQLARAYTALARGDSRFIARFCLALMYVMYLCFTGMQCIRRASEADYNADYEHENLCLLCSVTGLVLYLANLYDREEIPYDYSMQRG